MSDSPKPFRLGEVDYFIPLCCGRAADGRLRSKRISSAAVSALMFKPEAGYNFAVSQIGEARARRLVERNRERAALAQREIDEAPFINEETP